MSGMWPERLQFVSAIFVYGAGQRELAGIGRASVLRVGRMRSISVIVVCGGGKNELRADCVTVIGAFGCGLCVTILISAGFMKAAKLAFFVKCDYLCSIYCFLCKCYSVFKACSGQSVMIGEKICVNTACTAATLENKVANIKNITIATHF